MTEPKRWNPEHLQAAMAEFKDAMAGVTSELPPMSPEEFVEAVQAIISSRDDFEPSPERDSAMLDQIENLVRAVDAVKVLLNGEGIEAVRRVRTEGGE